MALPSSISPILASFFACAIVAGCGGSKPPPDTSASVSNIADAGAAMADDAGAAPTADTTTAPDAGPPAAPVAAAPKKSSKKNDPAWAACHASFKSTGKDMSVEVAKLAKGCAGVTKMKLLGTTTKGTQSETSAHQEIPFKAVAKHCYRVYAQSETTIKDLDLLLKESTGNIAAEDSTDDANPVLVEDGAVCFTANDDAVVVVSVGQGQGNYAIQIWGD